MKLPLLIMAATTGLGNLWAVYGSALEEENVNLKCVTCVDEAGTTASRVAQTPPSASISLSPATESTSSTGALPDHVLQEEVSSIPPTPSMHSPQSSSQLSTPAKAGIITASIVVFLLLLFVILDYTYLRRRRHESALKRAIEEVERGTELKEPTATESKENMVLESRVEIFVDGEEHGSGRTSWDGESQWDAGTIGEDDDGDLGEWGRGQRWERGRNGMSLPRRES